MKKFIFLLCLLVVSYLRTGYAQDLTPLSIPTPFIQGVNVITGQADETSSSIIRYDLYQEGWNKLEKDSFFLAKEDFRIGRVKAIHLSSPNQSGTDIYLAYEPGATLVYDTPERASVYRYNQAQLLQVVEHHQRKISEPLRLYRCERLFWQETPSDPHLISRVLEDEKGQVVLCYSFVYNEKGQLIKETLTGNLSGTCQMACKIGAEGYPEANGVESYSKTYLYSDDDDLLLAQNEDNGLTTTYQYDSPTKQCTAKLQGYKGGLLSRCFYIYDQEGFLEQTILDDGQGQQANDLTGVTQRQMIHLKVAQEDPVLGQPLKTESLYWDCSTQQEKSLESIEYFYSGSGQVIRQEFRDATGALRYDLRFNYDEKGELEATVDSRGEVALKEEVPQQARYNQDGKAVATIDPYGNETTYSYDAFGRLISTQFPTVLDKWDQAYHPLVTQTYNICDQIIEMIDPKGEKLAIRYNSRGKPIEIDYPDGSSERFTYFLDGALKEKRERNGTTFSFIRDEACRVIRSEKRSIADNLLQTLSYTYQGELVVTVTDDITFKTCFLYDGAGRQVGAIQKTEDGSRRLEWTYDACGQKSQVREWFGSSEEEFVVRTEQKDGWQNPKSTLFEDAAGQIKYQMNHSNSSDNSDFIFKQTSMTQNSLGQYVKQDEQVDGYGKRQVLIYDALLRVESLTQYNAMDVKLSETHFRYDAQGNKILEKHHVMNAGQSTRVFTLCWEYDASKRLLAIMEGDQKQSKTTRYRYNSYGQLEQTTKPDGTILFYVYTEDGQLDRFEASDHSFAYQYGYDHLQRLVTIHDLCHDIVQTRRYNAFHDLTENLQGIGVNVKHHYDAAGRRIGLTLPDGSGLTYHYQGPLLSSVARLGVDQAVSYQHGYVYDDRGHLKTCQLVGKLGEVSYHYNDKEHVVAIESPWWSQKIEEDGLDAYGRLLCMKVQDNRGEHVSHFTYTEDGQLASEDDHQYTYDSLFNRLSENGQSWQVNELNQLIQTPAASYVYDLNGNLIEKHSNNERVCYTYDALDRLVRVENPNQHAVTYIYDAFHRRLEQKNWEWEGQQKNWYLKSTAQFIYDGFKEIGKVDEQGKIVELRLLGQGQGAEMGAAIAIELQDKLFVPLHDSLGSVRCLIDTEQGQVVESYTYSAYGNKQVWDENGKSIEKSSVGNPWHFCSKRTDEETNFIFFGKRYYDPSMGRWLTPDPLFFYDTPNLYAFAKNDSLNHQDLYGLFSISQIWDNVVDTFFYCFHYLQVSAQHSKAQWNAELKLPAPVGKALEKVGKALFGETFYLLMGNHYEETQVDSYGQREISDKVRVTFINGILNTRSMMLKTLEVISESHGGVKIHYVYRPTEGWTWDISRAIMIRTAFALGFRSMHAHLLARMWRGLIQDMGGVGEGGTIIHYAHSLGGAETDRARGLLTLEEQQMIRVITFGSATLVRNVGFQSVVNMVSVNDGVSSLLLEPLGHLRNYFDPDTNVRYHGSFFGAPYWPTDHLLHGPTYGPIMVGLGEKFLAEFSPN